MPEDKKEEIVVSPEVEKIQIDKEEVMAGTKEAIHNEDAINNASKVESPKEEILPSFFIKSSDRVKINIDVIFDKVSGKILSISKEGMINKDLFKEYTTLGHVKETFTFSQPNYDDLTTYRQRSAIYRREVQKMVVDILQMRNFLIVWHLKDWTIRGADNNKIDLIMEANGALTDSCIKTVYGLHPSILDVVMSNFEKEILLA